MSEFNARAYWEDRIASNLGLHGVGYLGYGPAYNDWMYRVRSVIFRRTVRELGVKLSASSVLDIGSGTGFYVRMWRQLGAKRVTASDLTSAAIEHLRETIPDIRAGQLDIGRPVTSALGSERFDVISAMDVLFHIVDDAAFDQAIANIAGMLVPNGWFLMSDNFVHGQAQRINHQVSRTLDDITLVLQRSGLEPVKRTPMFVLMNAPTDTSSRWPLLAWRAAMVPVRLVNAIGHVQGALLFPLELLLTSVMSESPTTELLICRKTVTGG
ncbi:MAG TPA: class I SAM-dependent methyltransferase [Nitrospiraceae bacterium]|nr:class I SAM-dependent methyltransferase [Nitrospiraceae bacterium]